MLTFINNSCFGQLVYYLSNRNYCKLKEEQNDYVVPEKYLLSTLSTISSTSSYDEKSTNNNIIVTWDGEDDPENPRNWPVYQKSFFIFEVSFLTLAVYMGSAIYTPGVYEIQEALGVSEIVATLPLTLFVIGYGLGPIVFAPMSEIAVVGRAYIYVISLIVFMILQIPTALTKNIASLCVLRFLGGFFASPCLGNGPALVCDVLSIPYGAIGIGFWSVAAVVGPLFGPLIGAVLVVKGGWRWTFWCLCIVSGFALFLSIFLLPESFEKTLLFRKAKRLRTLTGNPDIVSEGELEVKHLNMGQIIIDTLWRPFEIVIFEPVVLLIDVYLALVYAIMYLWFEAFPIVFLEMKNFTVVLMGVSYLSTIVGSLIGSAIYTWCAYRAYTLKLLKNEEVYPEVFIPLAIFGAVCMPIGIFIFAWTSSPDIHWIGPMIGSAIFAVGAFIIFQSLFNYLGMSFWRYMASAFAGNALLRSSIGGAFLLFGRIMFENLGSKKFPVGWGSSILGFVSAGMISIPVLFYFNGSRLRARSRYSGTD